MHFDAKLAIFISVKEQKYTKTVIATKQVLAFRALTMAVDLSKLA